MSDTITVVAVDDHAIVLDGIQGRLSSINTIDVVAVGKRGKDVIPLVEEYRPDILLLDMGMPVDDIEENRFEAIAAIEQITRDFPATKIIVLSQTTEPILVKAAIQAGVKGYVDKLDLNSSTNLPDAINIIHRGSIYLSSSVHQKLSGDPARSPIELTNRQFLVLLAIASNPNAASKE
ncbi:MAG TPA: response regulator transcription factor, partial [Anaerolineae bacterium]|nr:response regulator transcription factor [Anaerolineae bacterium]